ncbi:hypothetical protein AK812_SmicGene8002 [Symbiodinium microadriaticum]|uniref:Uncharacterized protein n=1 Tax=Symbiodinium microadriaticum TaxID=2951 RepID=A0A1Q9EM39_SYMMI|nr:hypothetical protein AK812_SmicGene8002 [Symbiodinium microadriaticum]
MGAQRRGKAVAELPAVGTCQALAVEWSKEALQPSLPEKSFELIVVCDCLYENRDSWEALRSLLRRLPAPSATVLLASAMLRKPFLQAFVALLQEDGFALTSEEQGGRFGDVCIAFLRPPAASQQEASHDKETMAAVGEKVGRFQEKTSHAMSADKPALPVEWSKEVLQPSLPEKSFELIDQLKNVQQIQVSGGAFAAVLGDGFVVTWGSAFDGGDSSAVQDQLKNVQQIQASDHAFAAILGDGSVVTWGRAEYGGDSSAVQDQLKNVQQIQTSGMAFAAILGDGSVVTWGYSAYGGNSSAVKDQLKNVQQIQATGMAFAAVRGDGSVVTWGSADYGGDSSAVQDFLM